MQAHEPLKVFIARNGGVRLSSYRRLREQMIDWAVEDWPDESDPELLEDVLLARLAIRTRDKYGSFLAAFLVPVVVNLVANLIVRWWCERRENRTAMAAWVRDAKASDG